MSARIHLINPSDISFGVAVITPRWLYVLAAATGDRWGDPHIVDETLAPVEVADIAAGDVVFIPPGPDYPHQIVNDSDGELAYLSISTMMPAEVCEYPDSKKIGAFGSGLRHMTRTDDHMYYWTDEV